MVAQEILSNAAFVLGLFVIPAIDHPILPRDGAKSTEREWPHWRGPDRSGVSAETNWQSEGKKKSLWSKEVGRGYSSPSISEGRLYTIGFDEERKLDVIWCLDAETGKELWTKTSPAHIWNNMHGGGTLTTPTVDEDFVYVLSRLGPLVKLDKVTGAEQWSRPIHEEFEVSIEPFGFSSSPLVLDDLLFLNVGKTIALDKETGETVWETEDYGFSYSTPTPFEWEGEDCLAVFNGTGLVVLDRNTGDELSRHLWKSEYNVNSASPIVINDQVFISTGYNEIGCAMLSLEGGEMSVVWQNKNMNNKMNGCVLFEDHLYGFDKSLLKCLDLEGNEKWRARGLGMGTVIVAGDRLIVLSEEGELVVATVSADSFQELSRVRVFEEGRCWTTPVIVAGRIYCRNSLGKLVCHNRRPTSDQ